MRPSTMASQGISPMPWAAFVTHSKRTPVACRALAHAWQPALAACSGPAQPFTCARPSRRSKGARPRVASVCVRAAYQPYPFAETDYHRVEFMSHPYGPMLLNKTANAGFQGVLLFQRSDVKVDAPEDAMALEVFVSGDSALSVYGQITGTHTERPMALDLLWQMLQRGQDVAKREWTLVRAAIVELRKDVYIARLFFGDPNSREVLWDCDCRPSDATYLSLQTKAPLYIHRRVWEASAQPVRETQAFSAVQYAAQMVAKAKEGAQPQQQQGAAGSRGDGASAEPNPEDLPTVKLLVREMEVAVREEAYDDAARIRDHPYMRLASDIEMYTKIGYMEKARELYALLAAQIAANERADGDDYEARALRQLRRRGFPPLPGGGGVQGGSAAGAEEARKESGREG